MPGFRWFAVSLMLLAEVLVLSRYTAPTIGKVSESGMFSTVITDGEWLLSKNPDPATAAQIHFIIGDAYSDMVALAGGSNPHYCESFTQQEAEAAREKALQQIASASPLTAPQRTLRTPGSKPGVRLAASAVFLYRECQLPGDWPILTEIAGYILVRRSSVYTHQPAATFAPERAAASDPAHRSPAAPDLHF